MKTKFNHNWSKKSKDLFKKYLSNYEFNGESEDLLRLAIDYYELQLQALEELQNSSNLIPTGTGSYKPNPIANNISKYNACMINTLKLIGVNKIE